MVLSVLRLTPRGIETKNVCQRRLQIIGGRRVADGIVAIAMCALTV
jgi:hypothetical protein